MKNHKQKIETLRNILTEYAKYFRYFSSAKVYDVGLRFVILFEGYKPKKIGDGRHNRKIPYYDIDVIIARYRSKLDYEIKKYNDNKRLQMELINWSYSIHNLK